MPSVDQKVEDLYLEPQPDGLLPEGQEEGQLYNHAYYKYKHAFNCGISRVFIFKHSSCV